MKLTETTMYIVAYRKSENDEWLTSGLSYHNVTDAKNELSKQRHHLPNLFYQVFQFGRPMPLNLDIKTYEDIDR